MFQESDLVYVIKYAQSPEPGPSTQHGLPELELSDTDSDL